MTLAFTINDGTTVCKGIMRVSRTLALARGYMKILFTNVFSHSFSHYPLSKALSVLIYLYWLVLHSSFRKTDFCSAYLSNNYKQVKLLLPLKGTTLHFRLINKISSGQAQSSQLCIALTLHSWFICLSDF